MLGRVSVPALNKKGSTNFTNNKYIFVDKNILLCRGHLCCCRYSCSKKLHRSLLARLWRISSGLEMT
jgi:hypothetical protein